MVKLSFSKLLLKFFVNIKQLFIANLLSNGLHEKVMMCYIICYIIKSRLDVQFVKKILLEMVIGQQMKEEEYDQN